MRRNLYIFTALFSALFYLPLHAQQTNLNATDLSTLRLDDIRYAIGISRFGWTTIYVNCRSGYFRCSSGGGSVGDALGGQTAGSVEVNIGGPNFNDCTTNVVGKSCQDLLDIAAGNWDGTGEDAGGGGAFIGKPPPTLPVNITLPSNPDIIPREIKGSTWAGAYNSLTGSLKDPKTGKYVWALTTAHYPTNLQTTWNNSSGKFVLTGLSASMSIDIQMPKWVDIAGAKQCLQDAWSKMYQNLLAHEHGHVANYRLFEEFFKQELARIPPAPTQAALDQAVKAAFDEAVRRVNEVDKAYEAANTTSQGTTVNVSFDDCN